MKKIKPHHIPLMAKITGASQSILAKCSPVCLNALANIGITMIFTATISAAVAGFALAMISFKNISYYPFLAFGWFCFVLLYDRLIVISDTNSTQFVRVFSIILMSTFHSFIFDTITLSDDINRELEIQYANQLMAIESKVQSQKTPILEEIRVVRDEIAAINAKNLAFLDSLNAENEGLRSSGTTGIGPQYKALEERHERFKVLAKEGLESNNQRIQDLQSQLVELDSVKAKELFLISKPTTAGLLTRIEVMHEVVFHKGSITNLIFFCLWFCLFCLVEALPVLAKLTQKKHLEEYLTLSTSQSEVAIRQFVRTVQAQEEVEIAQSQQRTNEELGLLFTKAQNHALVERKESIIARFNTLEEFLSQLDEIADRIKNTFPSYFDEYVDPELNKARDEFQKVFTSNNN